MHCHQLTGDQAFFNSYHHTGGQSNSAPLSVHNRPVTLLHISVHKRLGLLLYHYQYTGGQSNVSTVISTQKTRHPSLLSSAHNMPVKLLYCYQYTGGQSSFSTVISTQEASHTYQLYTEGRASFSTVISAHEASQMSLLLKIHRRPVKLHSVQASFSTVISKQEAMPPPLLSAHRKLAKQT